MVGDHWIHHQSSGDGGVQEEAQYQAQSQAVGVHCPALVTGSLRWRSLSFSFVVVVVVVAVVAVGFVLFELIFEFDLKFGDVSEVEDENESGIACV